MNFTQLISSVKRSLRIVLVGLVCFTLLFSNASPAAAFGTNKSAPREGVDQLKGIQKETDKVANSAPLSMETSQARTENGLNAVQAGADKNKMYRPSNSEDGTTVKQDVKEFFSDITGGN